MPAHLVVLNPAVPVYLIQWDEIARTSTVRESHIHGGRHHGVDKLPNHWCFARMTHTGWELVNLVGFHGGRRSGHDSLAVPIHAFEPRPFPMTWPTAEQAVRAAESVGMSVNSRGRLSRIPGAPAYKPPPRPRPDRSLTQTWRKRTGWVDQGQGQVYLMHIPLQAFHHKRSGGRESELVPEWVFGTLRDPAKPMSVENAHIFRLEGVSARVARNAAFWTLKAAIEEARRLGFGVHKSGRLYYLKGRDP